MYRQVKVIFHLCLATVGTILVFLFLNTSPAVIQSDNSTLEINDQKITKLETEKDKEDKTETQSTPSLSLLDPGYNLNLELNRTIKEKAYYLALSDNEKFYYDCLYNKTLAILKGEGDSISFDVPFAFSREEFQNAATAFQKDYPYLQTISSLAKSYYYTQSLDNTHIDMRFLSEVSVKEGTALNEEFKTLFSNSYKEAVALASASYSSLEERLTAYKDYIVTAVEYDTDFLYSDSFNNDLSQSDTFDSTYYSIYASNFAYVFNSSFNQPVICKAYSDAFALLCDLSGIDDCYSANGTLSKLSHEWNILYNNDKKYLIDLSSLDTAKGYLANSFFLKEIPDDTSYTILWQYEYQEEWPWPVYTWQ